MTNAIPPMAAGSSSADMARLVLEIARSLCDNPGGVSVESLPDGDATVLRLRVAPEDVGKVIGRQGRTARSLRTILTGASMKLKQRYTLDIVEEDAPRNNGASDTHSV